MSGYSFQYDPGYANVNAGFGKALLLRLWENGKECGTPIAKVKWPKGLEVNDKHKIVVVNEGDTLYASIDGIKMFDVPSLKTAIKTSGCKMAGAGRDRGRVPQLERLLVGAVRKHDAELILTENGAVRTPRMAPFPCRIRSLWQQIEAATEFDQLIGQCFLSVQRRVVADHDQLVGPSMDLHPRNPAFGHRLQQCVEVLFARRQPFW